MPEAVWLIAALVVFLALMFAGVWVGVAMGVATLIGLIPVLGAGRTLDLFAVQAYGQATSFTTLAVPLFLFMAEVVTRSGMVSRAYAGLQAGLSGLPGGPVQITIPLTTVFSALSGSSLATAVTAGKTMYPELKALGYPTRPVVGALAAGGTLGILIPPSIIMIIYGQMAEESVGQLFLAGVVPGIVLSAIFMGYTLWRFRRSQYTPPPRLVKPTLTQRLRGFARLWPLALLIGLVMGAIYGGVMTPTEAAAGGAFFAIILTLITKTFSLKALRLAALSAVETTAMIFFLVIVATVMSRMLVYYNIPAQLTGLTSQLPPVLLLVFIVLLYLFLGMFLEGLSMMVLTLPFLLPVLDAAGINGVWFGVFLVILLELDMLTPPVGINLFAIAKVTGVSVSEVTLGGIPYILLMLGMLVVIYFLPQLALWLPGLSL